MCIVSSINARHAAKQIQLLCSDEHGRAKSIESICRTSRIFAKHSHLAMCLMLLFNEDLHHVFAAFCESFVLWSFPAQLSDAFFIKISINSIQTRKFDFFHGNRTEILCNVLCFRESELMIWRGYSCRCWWDRNFFLLPTKKELHAQSIARWTRHCSPRPHSPVPPIHNQ